MSPIEFPWDAENIHDLAMRINLSANRLVDETSMPSDNGPVPTLTYEEAVMTLALGVTQMHATISNSFTAVALGMEPEENE